MTSSSTSEPYRDLFAEMLLIRRFEERLIQLKTEEAFPGHYHVYIGQEATGVGVCAQLGADDVVFTNHRNHGHLLARGADPGRMYAEILGRRGGYSKGKAGSFHLAVPELGIPYTSAAVGGSIPVATGAALAVQRQQRGAIVVCFIGDGVLEQGAFYEAINIAALWRLPILYVCENNGIGTVTGIERAHTSPSASLALPALTDAPDAFQITSRVVDGRDLDAMAEVARQAVDELRNGAGPWFIEARTNRWPGNRGTWPAMVGGPTVFPEIEPTASEQPESASGHREWAEQSDPLRLAFRRGLRDDRLTPADVARLDAETLARIDGAVAWATSTEEPGLDEAFTDVVAEGR